MKFKIKITMSWVIILGCFGMSIYCSLLYSQKPSIIIIPMIGGAITLCAKSYLSGRFDERIFHEHEGSEEDVYEDA